MANFPNPVQVRCIKTLWHPTRKQEKTFLKGSVYDMRFEFLKGKSNRDGWYFEVYKLKQHTTRNPEFAPLGPMFRISVLLKLPEFLLYFLPLDPESERFVALHRHSILAPPLSPPPAEPLDGRSFPREKTRKRKKGLRSRDIMK